SRSRWRCSPAAASASGWRGAGARWWRSASATRAAAAAPLQPRRGRPTRWSPGFVAGFARAGAAPGALPGSGSEVRQPALVLRVLAGDEVEEGRLQRPGDRAAAAAADLAAVDLADRRHLGGRAGEEDLVGDVQLVARDAALLDRDAAVAGQHQDRLARDAGEHGGQRRRAQDAVAHEEEVLAARLGDEPLGVQHDGLVVAVEKGIAL